MADAALKIARDPEHVDAEITALYWADDCGPRDLRHYRGRATLTAVFRVGDDDEAVRAEINVTRWDEPQNGSSEWTWGCWSSEGSTADVAEALVWLARNEDIFWARVERLVWGRR